MPKPSIRRARLTQCLQYSGRSILKTAPGFSKSEMHWVDFEIYAISRGLRVTETARCSGLATPLDLAHSPDATRRNPVASDDSPPCRLSRRAATHADNSCVVRLDQRLSACGNRV